MKFSGRQVAIRALNSIRGEHLLSYVSLRLLLRSIPESTLSEWIESFIARKHLTRRAQAYLPYPSLKSLEKNGPKYRSCLAPSPTTALSESWLLGTLSKQRPFANQRHVFSYRWPSRDVDRYPYQYFFDGYRRRNQEVARALRTIPKSVAVIADIAAFYPSTDKERVIQRFFTHIDKSEITKSEIESAKWMIEGLMRSPVPGIPVGPATAHVLGNLALLDADETILKRFPGRYFRYVDDLVIVCESSQRKDAEATIREALGREGLKPNPDKWDCITENQWRHEIPAHHRNSECDQFSEILDRIKLFLARQPRSYHELATALTNIGTQIPMNRLMATSRSGRYHRFAKTWQWLAARLPWRTDTIDRICGDVLLARKSLQQQLITLHETSAPESVQLRRWHIQKYRFVLNRLLYLTPCTELTSLHESIPPLSDFAPLKAVVKALIKGDASELLACPGVPIITFAQFWEHLYPQKPPSLAVSPPDPNNERGLAQIESLALLATFGLWQPQESWILSIPPGDIAAYLAIAVGHDTKPPLPRFGYIDEMRSLRMHTNRNDLQELMMSRFDNMEEIVLDALRLDGGTYAS